MFLNPLLFDIFQKHHDIRSQGETEHFQIKINKIHIASTGHASKSLSFVNSPVFLINEQSKYINHNYEIILYIDVKKNM